MRYLFNKLGLLAVTGVAATLVGCGGNDDTYLDLKGFAATGLALDNAAVSVKCVSGTGTATTLANGSYAVTVVNGEGPCLVTVTKGAVTLRSISAKTTTGNAVANVTQFTDAIVTALVTAKGAANVDALVTNSANVPSNAQLTAAVTAVITKINEALTAAGKPLLTTSTDLLGGTFTPATTTTASTDPLDNALDFLVAPGTTVLPPTLVNSIKNEVVAVVPTSPTAPPRAPTGATGAGGV